ncbi:hypothetical protein NM688_g2627 [Phlebia brevispora]|uniref:Uncharacterized protein n=1 Tax=Phlebia brevispora TaxID=194682 RepID=A0ACC1T7Z1_9APHY|nr:hypothetical protein NM688_g2627 [Phlebia brevispora]
MLALFRTSASRTSYTHRLSFTRAYVKDASFPPPPNLTILETPEQNAQARVWIEQFKSHTIPRELVDLAFSRSSGPGGQNVNKVNTKATLRCPLSSWWIPAWARDALKRSPSYVSSSQSILITSTVYRSQAQNIQECLGKLHTLVLSASSSELINEPSEEQKQKVRKYEQAEKAHRRHEKDKRSATKRSRKDKDLRNRPAFNEDGSASPYTKGLFANIREDIHAALLEFCGTTVFLTLAFGGVQASGAEAASTGSSPTSVERIMYAATSFGLSLLISAWLFFRVTGGLFNPNVSLALLLTGVIEPVRFVLYCIAQLVGGIAAAALVLGLTPGPVSYNTKLAPGVNPAQGVFIEAFITATLCLAVLMLAAEKHIATPFAPVGIGLTLFVCHLFAIYYTGCGMNTARSFGPAVVTGFPYGTHWVSPKYWVGPGIGSLIAVGFYSVLKHYRYWRFNPGADTTDSRNSPDDPVAKAINRSRSRGSRTSRDMEGRKTVNDSTTNTSHFNDSPV